MSNDETDQKAYKIQKIVCSECKQVLGGRFVKLIDEDYDYGFCFWCLRSFCKVGEALNDKKFPTSAEVKKLIYFRRIDISIGLNMMVEHNLEHM